MANRSFFVLMIFLALVSFNDNKVNAQGPIQLIRNLLQNNLVGAPVVHKVTEWDFDPDVSIKRRSQFYELHGYRASKLIERVGLGIDGNDHIRLEQQRARDLRKLGDVPVSI